MNDLPQYIVAKYASDLNRMEPKNIGIVVWCNGRTATRFLEAEDADFVEDTALFCRWTQFWKDQAELPAIRVGGRTPVSRLDSRFVDELCRTEKGHYLLYKAGRIHEDLAPSDIEDVAAFLFDRLVSFRRPPEIARPGDDFTAACNAVIEEAGLTRRDDWLGERSVRFKVQTIEQEYQFNYVVGNGTPTVVGHRVPLRRPLNVNSAAFLFEWVGRSRVVSHKRNRLALVNTESVQDVDARVRLLGTFATIVDVADHRNALKALAKIE